MENTGLGGVTVRLSGMADAQTATDNSGNYAFTGLRAGTYSVEISGFDGDEVGFGSISSSATVGVGESKIISFDGTYLRTAGIMGQVSVEGVGLAGVTVTMTGEGEDETDVTDAGGLYGFSKLKAGNYSVAISGFDPDEVEFSTTSMNVSVALGETANIPFMGTLLRTSGISGRVSVEGMGIPNATVTLAGAAEATYTTMDDGQYAFAGLAEGTYVVSMTNPNADAYNFEMTSATIVLGDSESNITNFEGTHTRTASVSGVLFIDEVMQDKMHTAGEPSLTAALAPLVEHGLLDPVMLAGLLTHAKVVLRGPDLNTMTEVPIMPDGSFTTGEALQAGSYQVELPANNEVVAAALAAAGVAFVGESAVVTVEAAGSAMVNFPFRITMQTIGVGAVMGNDEMTGGPVGDVTLALFPTAQDAEDGTNLLGMGAKTNEMGMAGFQFARADDTSPGSDDSDNLVFVKVVETGHDDLRVSANDIIEIEYPGIARVHSAPAHVRLVNVAVNVQFWIKSNKEARSGDEGLGGWKTEIFMGDPTAEDAMALTKQDPKYPDDPTKTVNITDPTDDGEDVEADAGKTAFSYMAVDADGMPDLPATFYVTLPPYNKQSADGGEMWTSMADDEALGRSEDGSMLMYEHTGLMLPDDDAVDLGATRITFTTQKLTVGVYRESDDVPGFTDYRSQVPGGGGDTRPNAAVAAELQVELMVENSRGRLERYEYMSFDAKGKRTVDVANPKAFEDGTRGSTLGRASFPNLPADEEFTVRFQAGSDRAAVTHEDASLNGRDVDAYGDDLAGGMSVGGFGDMSGGGHTVSLCPLTTSDTPGQSANSLVCATFAYQWTTGTISGEVTLGGEAVGDKAVRLDAVTSGHSPSESKKTVKSGSAKGEYAFSNVQDGEYEVVVAETSDHGEKKSTTLVIYHDENTERTGDEITGTPQKPVTADIALSSTKLRIQGYVANDDGDGIVRGDEAVEGIVMELRNAAFNRGTGKWVPSGAAIQAVETGADGFYDFPSVPERSGANTGYFVTAVGSDYAAVVDDATDNVSNRVFPAPDRDITDGEFDLPSWDYDDGTIEAGTHVVKPKDELGNELAQFVNFALLHKDGKVTGRVREAAGNHKGITVELARCETVEDDATEDDGRACESAPRKDFPPQRAVTGAGGYWELPDLLEGWYRVNVGDAGFSPAMLDADGDIDDDGDVQSQENYVKIVEGKLDVASRANFFVFDNTGDDDGLDGVSVTGKTSIDDAANKALAATVSPSGQSANGMNDISAARAPVITWASETIDVTPSVDDDASFVVETDIGTAAAPRMQVWEGRKQGDATATSRRVTVEPEYYDTNHAMHGMPRTTKVYVTVSAENGYDDHIYTFDIMRSAPVNNNLAELDFGVLRTAVNTDIPVPAITSGRGNVERVASVPATTGPGSTMSVFIKARMQEGQMGMVAEVDGTEIFPETSISGENDRIHRVYEIEDVPRTGDIETVVILTVTSEDDIEKTYEITLNRGAAPTPSATLTNLTLSGVTLSFASATTTYTASVANDVASTTVTATPATGATAVITPADADANTAGHQVNLAEGANPISIAVTGAGMTPRTYTVRVTRDAPGVSSNADLSGLRLSAGTLTPAFNAATTSYTASVPNATTTVTVTATKRHASASVAYDPGSTVTLDEGVAKTITVTVTAGDGTTKAYTVTVTRAGPGGSNDATLSALSLNDGDVTLNEVWAATTYAYTADVGNSVATALVAATATDEDGATVTLPDPNPVDLDEGTTTITVTVTAEAGNTQDYTVTVTRAAAPTTPGVRVSIGAVAVNEGTERDYTVRLATRPSGDVTVTIAVEAHADNPAGANVAHITTTRTSLIFNETNWNRARTVTISVAEEQPENEITEIANINHTAGDYTPDDTVAIKVTATDNDVVAGAAIRVDRTSVTLTEGDDADDAGSEVMVRLAVVPTGEVIVTAVTSEEDDVTVSAALTFDASNWDDEQPITVTAVSDEDPADDKATVTLTAAGGGYGSAEKVEVAVTVEDDEEATISVTDDFKDAEVVEGGTLTYMISLSAPPVEGETVRVNLQVLGLATVQPAQAVFDSNTSGNAIEITVSTLHDSDDNDAAFTIRHSVDADEDSGYKGAAAPSNISVTVKDDEAAGVVVSHTSLSVEEGGTAEYTIRLTKAPSSGETVTIHLAGTGVNLSGGSLTFTGVAPQTVTVTGHTDSNSVDDQATVVHTVVTTGGEADYDGVIASTVRITVTEPSS